MGPFASTVEFYARYREPYPAAFFQKVAEQIALRGDETLLDVACGPGLLAIGFAPFVGRCTGLDPEPGMIVAAKAAAEEAGVRLSLIQGKIEELPTMQTYDVITIGRALHWLDRAPTLAVLERILATDSGRVLICRSSSVETPETPWVKPYRKVRSAWASDPSEKRYRFHPSEWFADSCFGALGETSVTEHRQVTIADLIGRALSRSNTSPEVVAGGQEKFEAQIAAALEPFAQDGVLIEQVVARATIFGRLP
ncbi:MAG: class I SAM-dependent methyltransferase [Terriglobales bacterium]|jgi:SAM-dependent methyltransferase